MDLTLRNYLNYQRLCFNILSKTRIQKISNIAIFLQSNSMCYIKMLFCVVFPRSIPNALRFLRLAWTNLKYKFKILWSHGSFPQ